VMASRCAGHGPAGTWLHLVEDEEGLDPRNFDCRTESRSQESAQVARIARRKSKHVLDGTCYATALAHLGQAHDRALEGVYVTLVVCLESRRAQGLHANPNASGYTGVAAEQVAILAQRSIRRLSASIDRPRASNVQPAQKSVLLKHRENLAIYRIQCHLVRLGIQAHHAGFIWRWVAAESREPCDDEGRQRAKHHTWPRARGTAAASPADDCVRPHAGAPVSRRAVGRGRAGCTESLRLYCRQLSFPRTQTPGSCRTT